MVVSLGIGTEEGFSLVVSSLVAVVVEGDILGRLVRGEFGRDGGMRMLESVVFEGGGVDGRAMPCEL